VTMMTDEGDIRARPHM